MNWFRSQCYFIFIHENMYRNEHECDDALIATFCQNNHSTSYYSADAHYYILLLTSVGNHSTFHSNFMDLKYGSSYQNKKKW